MVQYRATEAAAGQAVGTNIFQGNRGETRWYPRILRHLAVVGSDAAGNGAVTPVIGDSSKGEYPVTATGTSYQRNRDQQDVNILIPPFVPLRLETAVVSVTNAINTFLDIVP